MSLFGSIYEDSVPPDPDVLPGLAELAALAAQAEPDQAEPHPAEPDPAGPHQFPTDDPPSDEAAAAHPGQPSPSPEEWVSALELTELTEAPDPTEPADRADLTEDPDPGPRPTTLCLPESLDDDLLPTRPRRSDRVGSLRSLAAAPDGRLERSWARQSLAVAAAVLIGLAAAAAVNHFRSSPAAPSSSSAANPAPADLPPTAPSPGAANPRAELDRAVLAAAATYAEQGSFQRSADEWGELIGRPVLAAPAPASEGTLIVMSAAEAVCFETVTSPGAAWAVGITPAGARYSQSASGGPLCSVDPATLAGWSANLR